VFLIVGRDAERPGVFCHSDFDRRSGAGDPLFELADAGEVFIELAAIRGARRFTELTCIVAHEV
jgi:hypothetical protein